MFVLNEREGGGGGGGLYVCMQTRKGPQSLIVCAVNSETHKIPGMQLSLVYFVVIN